MIYLEAKQKAQTLKVVGFLAALPLLLTVLASLLLMLYHGLDTGSALSAAIARPFKNLVYYIYDNTRFLELFWAIAPVPNPQQLNDIQNLYFGIVYVCLLMALSMIGVGRQIQRRHSWDYAYERRSYRSDRETGHPLPHEPREPGLLSQTEFWKALHTYYIAPIVGAVLGGLILHFVFGVG